MKKVFPILVAILLIGLGVQFIVVFFSNEHQVEYAIKNKKRNFKIREYFKYKNGKNYYDFIVTYNKKDKYIFSYNENLNKQKQIIKDIKYFENGNLKCLSAIYSNDDIGKITCRQNDELADFSYLKQTDSKILKFVDQIKKDGYNSELFEDKKEVLKTYRDGAGKIFYVYKGSIPKNYTFGAWNYNGMLFMNSDKSQIKNLLGRDLYDNSKSILVGKYYFVFNFNNGPLNDITYINMTDYGKTTMPLPETLSSDMYVNGVYKNVLYVTDIKNRRQFKLDPYKEKMEIVDGFKILKNDKLESMEKVEYFKENRYFEKKITVKEINKKFGDVYIYSFNDFYYFKDDKGTFYRVNKNSLDSPIKLFTLNAVKYYKFIDDDILIINDDTFYFYNYKYGLRKIVKNKEFKFNYNNICTVYKKS